MSLEVLLSCVMSNETTGYLLVQKAEEYFLHISLTALVVHWGLMDESICAN